MKSRAKQKHIQSPEEIAKVLDTNRKKLVVKEKLFPALVGATVSIDEAKMLLQSLSGLIMEDSLIILKEKKIEAILDRLVKKLCPDGEREKEVRELLVTLSAETLYDAKVLVEGLSNSIEYMLQSELKDRTLNSLEPDWDKILTK